MHIAIDASPLAYPARTGIGRYLESMLTALPEHLESHVRVTLLSGRPLLSPAVRSLVAKGMYQARHDNFPSLFAWSQTLLGLRLAALRPDVFFAVDGLLPLVCPVPALAMVHDALWSLPEAVHPWHVKTVYRLRAGASLRSARLAVCGTREAKAQMRQAVGPVADKLRVVPCFGIAPGSFAPPAPADEPALHAFRRAHGLKDGFLLTVGNLMPHKNLRAVVQAMNVLFRQGRDVPQVAVVGHGDPAPLRAGLEPGIPADKLICLGFVPDDELRQAYQAASALVFPSLREGFGLPILEAQASGLPVLCSKASSMPEAAGDAALYFDPQSPDELARVIDLLRTSPKLVTSLKEQGLANAAGHSLSVAARTLRDLFFETVGAASA